MRPLFVVVSALVVAHAFGCAQAGGGDGGGAGDGGIHPDVSSDGALDGATTSCDPASDTCPSTQYCSDSLRRCVDGCRRDDACPEAKPHCDLTTHVCQNCLANDHCPAGQACSGNLCVPSCSASRPCAGGTTCCAGACVDVATNTANCGGCGTKCVVPGGVPTCVGGACKVGDCGAGYADCNGKLADGCETILASDPANCGKCGQVCGGAHASPSCSSGTCALKCDAGFGDCNLASADGCEADLAHDTKNCGACGATPKEVCNGVDDDCDGVPDDGFACVKGTPTKSCTTSCGSTGTQACNADCSLGGCAPPAETCNAADDDCNGKCDDVDGCRVAVERSYKSSTGEHFYTTSDTEAHCCGYTLENASAYYLYASSAPGLVPFYRCVLGSGYHFTTQNSACEGAGTVEGVIGYIATAATCGAVPLYRLSSKSNGDHLFTTDAAEKASASSGYNDEGVAGYVWTVARP